MVWLPVFGIFNVHTDVDACDCAQELYKHQRESATESWLLEKNPLLHLDKSASVLHLAFQLDTLPPELSQICRSSIVVLSIMHSYKFCWLFTFAVDWALNMISIIIIEVIVFVCLSVCFLVLSPLPRPNPPPPPASRADSLRFTCTLLCVILVQFSSRWYLLYALHPVSQKFPQHHLWNGSILYLRCYPFPLPPHPRPWTHINK